MPYKWNSKAILALRLEFTDALPVTCWLNDIGEAVGPAREVKRLDGREIAITCSGDYVLSYGALREVASVAMLGPSEVEEIRKQIVADYALEFCKNADSSIWTMEGDPHKSVRIEIGELNAEVDELIAPVIRELWRLKIFTTGACQEMTTKLGKEAYIEVVGAEIACKVESILTEAGIHCRKKDRPCLLVVSGIPVQLPFVQLFFPSADIERAARVLQTIASPTG